MWLLGSWANTLFFFRNRLQNLVNYFDKDLIFSFQIYFTKFLQGKNNFFLFCCCKLQRFWPCTMKYICMTFLFDYSILFFSFSFRIKLYYWFNLNRQDEVPTNLRGESSPGSGGKEDADSHTWSPCGQVSSELDEQVPSGYLQQWRHQPGRQPYKSQLAAKPQHHENNITNSSP